MQANIIGALVSPDLERLARDACMVRSVDRVPRGHLRMETRFLYPDRSSIDVFILDGAQASLPGGKRTLSDLGQTMLWLNDLLVRPWQSKKRQGLLEDTLRVLDVRQNGGALETDFDPAADSLVDAVVRLGQACVRVADLTFTRRSTVQVNAGEEVEEILSDAALPYEANVTLPGRQGSTVSVDFLVHGRRQRSALLTLAAQYQGMAHTSANEVFRKMYDLKSSDQPEQRITVYDDRVDVYKGEDLERLRDVSDVVPLSQRTELVTLLAA
jgi:hypothetical protein